jgi:hypothetical protein
MTTFPLTGNINDPDWPEENNPKDLQEVVEQFLTFNVLRLSDYIEETELLSDEVHRILFDVEDDKLGRIKDLYDAEITRVAKWVDNHAHSNKHAAWLLTQAMGA